MNSKIGISNENLLPDFRGLCKTFKLSTYLVLRYRKIFYYEIKNNRIIIDDFFDDFL